MAKHFHLAITDTSFEFTRIEDAIAEEALLEGFCVCGLTCRRTALRPQR
jgi:hypothetical protein